MKYFEKRIHPMFSDTIFSRLRVCLPYFLRFNILISFFVVVFMPSKYQSGWHMMRECFFI